MGLVKWFNNVNNRINDYERSLKRSFLAAFPVIGPHADIEAELMLAGRKPLTWLNIVPDEFKDSSPRAKKMHRDIKLLDKAVAEGKLLSIDVKLPSPGDANIIRHYAQPEQEESLKLMSEFNRQIWNCDDTSKLDLDKLADNIGMDKNKGFGEYLGYKKRDILFFKYTTSMPKFISNALINLNASCQQARVEKSLIETGHDLQKWYNNLPKM